MNDFPHGGGWPPPNKPRRCEVFLWASKPTGWLARWARSERDATSDYKKAQWCEKWDQLFWDFKNPLSSFGEKNTEELREGLVLIS